ncbi:MAG: hypothetical protein HY079_09270 [Elusimicrobia bacterium]|nr:hypothetical protein [Elusimicrobiota bacterium]
MKGLLFLTLLLVGPGGCVRVERAPGAGGTVIRIEQGQVGAVHGLRAGVVNVFADDRGGGPGARKPGLTAALTLFVDGDPPQEKDFTVRAGQRITLAGYSVYV